jgi:cysteine synthase
MIFENFAESVGRTSCVRYRPPEDIEARFWVKLEGFNPTGSVKDRGCVYIVRSAIERGLVKKGMTLLDASSGNMACALAYFGAVLGYPVTVVCSSKLTSDKAAFIQYYGARLEKLGDFTIEGNLYCRNVLARAEPDRYVFLDQLHNWENPRAHYETTGPEIVSDLPQVQAIAGSLGSGGTMNGVARFIKEHHPAVKIITAESAPGTKIPGTGSFSDGDFVTPFIEQLRERNLVDSWQMVGLQQAQERTKSLAKQGFFCGIQTGAVMEAAIRAATEMQLKGDVLIISGDSGWKNMDKLTAM